MKCVERIIPCSDGLKLAAKHWPSQTSAAGSGDAANKVLCLHGWLDNCASFDLLAPALWAKAPGGSAEVLALDFPGHGLSSHKSPDGPSQLLAEYAFYTHEVVQQMGWTNFTIVGHSMGAGVATIYAAAFPDAVKGMALLDGAGPLARKAEDISRHVRAAVERRSKSNKFLYPSLDFVGSSATGEQGGNGVRVYPSLDSAIETRMNTAKLSPGSQYLSREAAEAMVRRATVPVLAAGDDISNGGMEGPVKFRHDPRLQWPSLQYFTREQVQQLYRDVQCPVCIILAEDGWPFDRRSIEDVEQLLQPTSVKKLPGSHHFHADPESAPAVIEEVVAFFATHSSTRVVAVE
eukprot:CAMPEP_0197452306 /NCGR_PEP_ID=MMETSP1175-20131217/31762_1 /TAXON_ID=1003142 /ORGANISM="Triceratium dubium, Strain CCMP147" /LENGTH=347 /DNA_ID=CAMNT_0042985283 /DNA_START=69 /DNA_END=1112 /DNA_ORIENTATION=-